MTNGKRSHRSVTSGSLSPAAGTTVGALIIATAGVVVQIVAGVDFPTVPPLLFILLIPAAVLAFPRWRWAARARRPRRTVPHRGAVPERGISAPVRYVPAGGVGGSTGLWVQTVAVVAAAVAGIAVTVQRYRTAATERGE